MHQHHTMDARSDAARFKVDREWPDYCPGQWQEAQGEASHRFSLKTIAVSQLARLMLLLNRGWSSPERKENLPGSSGCAHTRRHELVSLHDPFSDGFRQD